jgi:hypothetical protein
MPEELAGTGTPTQAQQGVSKKNPVEEGETDSLLLVAVRLSVK